MRADLHVHTTASDGRLTPKEIVHLAVKSGLNVIAITDHDSVDGITPALDSAKALGSLIVIPGVEINTDVPRGEVHILGYFIDYTDSRLRSVLQRLRASRENRAVLMIRKLQSLGMKIEWEQVRKLAGSGSVGRPHVAQALLERGYVVSLKEAFDKYIGRNGPAYIEREKITPAEAVKLVAQAQGLPVLAHPANVDGLNQFLHELINVGLVGIEVWYNNYTPEIIGRIKAIASKYKLVATGGSDYHGFADSTETVLGGVTVPVRAIEQLFDLAGINLESSKSST